MILRKNIDSTAASKAYSFNGRQGDARGFIVKRVWGMHRYFVSKFAVKGNSSSLS